MEAEIPIVSFPGSDVRGSGRELGRKLEARFPGQYGDDFGFMTAFNGHPLGGLEVTELSLLHGTPHNGENWIWEVRASGKRYKVTARCDYTGWVCQPDAEWEELPW